MLQISRLRHIILPNDMFGIRYIILQLKTLVNGGIMKSKKRILLAFILNLLFSVFEFFGGIFTGSVAVLSDSLHDLGDAASIGISYFLERKSEKGADKKHTFGYARYSVLGGLITSAVLILGSCAVIYNAVIRIIDPVGIDYNGMIIFALVGVTVNFAAAYFTHGGHSLNQRAVNLHMLEDVLGWAAVLFGAVIMRFTDIKIIDPIMSLAVACFIIFNCIKNMKNMFDIFLEKVPEEVDIEEITEQLLNIEGVSCIKRFHIWTLDGNIHFASMYIITENLEGVKGKVREKLKEHGITNSVIEICDSDENIA
ncbi:MAG: cation transporter [Ruminococcaceae bacterium]|nr:cation transporter [Oscillospiraceae bacterium]